MNTTQLRPIEDIAGDFCVFLEEDGADLCSIVERVAYDRPGTSDLMEDSLSVIRIMLSNGMAVGDPLYVSGEFNAWANQNPDSVVERVRREWLALGRTPSILDIAYFSPGPERLRTGQDRASSRSASGR